MNNQSHGTERIFGLTACFVHPSFYVGRGGSPRAPEEDATAGERPRPDPGEAHERQPATRREGEGPAERKSKRLDYREYIVL